MPYSINPTSNGFEVVDDSGAIVGTHPTRAQAIAQQRALYANVPDASAKESQAAPIAVTTDEQRKANLIERIIKSLKEGRRNSDGDAKRLQDIHDLAVANGASCPMVFKEAGGRLRWVMFTSNSFQDTDREIVSQAALERDVDRTDKERNYGPLRWWHVGNPDLIMRKSGGGIDIGDCDFRAMHGRMLIESGTFRNERIGEAIKERADTLAGSIGFFHSLSQPDHEGVFTDIHTFERSLLPRGRASNPLTALTVTKEINDMATMKEKFDEFKKLLGGDEALAQSVISRAEQTEKEAQDSGLKFKEGETIAPVEVAPVAEVVAETDKAAKKPAKKAKVSKGKGGGKKGGKSSGGGGLSEDKRAQIFGNLREEGRYDASIAGKESAEIEDEAETEVDADEIFEAIRDDVAAMIDERLAAVGKERTEKEAGLTAQINTLAAQLKEANDKLAVLNSDLPRGVRNAYRASQDVATINEQRPALKEQTAPNPLADVFTWLASPTPTPQ